MFVAVVRLLVVPSCAALAARPLGPRMRQTEVRGGPWMRRLRAAEEEAPEPDLLSSVVNSTTAAVEGAVRTVTGDNDYKFGDITKRTIKDLTGKEASEYEFGDVTRKAVTSFTGKEDYHFGDITTKVLSETEKAAGELRASYFADLPSELSRAMFQNLDAAQRTALMIAIGSYGSIVVLTWSLVSWAITGVVACASWAWTARVAELAAPRAKWTHFLSTVYTVRLLEAAFLPIKALLSFLLVPKYHRAVQWLEPRLPLRESAATLNRAFALAAAYAAGTLAVAAATAAGLLLAG